MDLNDLTYNPAPTSLFIPANDMCMLSTKLKVGTAQWLFICRFLRNLSFALNDDERSKFFELFNHGGQSYYSYFWGEVFPNLSPFSKTK